MCRKGENTCQISFSSLVLKMKHFHSAAKQALRLEENYARFLYFWKGNKLAINLMVFHVAE